MSCEESKFQKFWFDRRIKQASKPKEFQNYRIKFATEEQMREINDVFMDVYGHPLFTFVSAKEYLSKILIQNGRDEVNLEKEPITIGEAQEIIVDLKKWKERISKKGKFEKWLRRRILTTDRMLGLNPITKELYDRHKEDDTTVKRTITKLNQQISPDNDDPRNDNNLITIFNHDKNGNITGVKKKIKSSSVANLLGLLEKVKTGKFSGRTELSLLREWNKLRSKAVNSDDAKDVVLLRTFEKTIPDLIEKIRKFKAFVEGNDAVLNLLNKKDRVRFKLAGQVWKATMDELWLFSQETVDKWVDGRAKNGKRYSDLFKEEFTKQLKLYRAGLSKKEQEKLNDKAIARIVGRFDISAPRLVTDYFPHIAIEGKQYLKSDIYAVIRDLNSGKLNIDALLSYAKGNEFWNQRKDLLGDDDIYLDPIGVAEARILSDIQTRKMLSLRALTLDTLDQLEKQKQKLAKIDDSKLFDGKKFNKWKQDASDLIQSIEGLELYVKTLAADAQGVPREASAFSRFILGKIGNINDVNKTTAQISRIYRSVKIGAYLTFSVKAAMTNWQQSFGPIFVKYGFKRALAAQVDMGLVVGKSKRGRIRNFINDKGEEVSVDIIDQVGIKFDDILSLAERSLPRIKKELVELESDPLISSMLDKIEEKLQKTVQFGLEHSILGRLVNFVDTEFRNRGVAALAAYDATIDKLKKQGITGEKAHNKAIKEARQFVNDTQFDYSVFNRPEILRGNLGASVLLFKSFAINNEQMQFDWIWDAKRNFLKNGKLLSTKEGVAKIPYSKVSPIIRFGILKAIQTLMSSKLWTTVGLLTIPSLTYDFLVNLWKLLFSKDPDVRNSAFFGLGDYGPLLALFSGPVGDFANLVFMLSNDERFKKRGVRGLWDGLIPGEKQLRRTWKDVSAIKSYFYDGDSQYKNFGELLLDIIANDLFTIDYIPHGKKGLKKPKKVGKLKKLKKLK